MIPDVPPGIRYPHPRLSPLDPNARGSPAHDEDDYPWAGQVGDFSYMNVFPWSLRKLGEVGTFTASQLRAYGFWGTYDRAHADHAPRVRQPWPVPNIVVNSRGDCEQLHAADNGGLYDTVPKPGSMFCGRMVMMDRWTASRDREFNVASPDFQLLLKSDVEYMARVLDATQPEYWREWAQRKYKEEYLTTRLVVSVISSGGDFKKRYRSLSVILSRALSCISGARRSRTLPTMA